METPEKLWWSNCKCHRFDFMCCSELNLFLGPSYLYACYKLWTSNQTLALGYDHYYGVCLL